MNNKTNNNGLDEDVMEVAADWYDRQETITDDERGAFNDWLAASPDHARAYGLIRQTMLDVALLDASFETRKIEARDGVVARPQIATPNSRFKNWLSAGREHLDRLLPSPTAWAGAAAALAILVAGPVLFLNANRAAEQAETLVFATVIGERADVALTDATEIFLDADTRITTAFAAEERRVDLQRGEAVFHVTKDEARPFSVYAGAATVTVTGTQFGVSLAAAATDIRVYEGSVRVAHGFGAPLDLAAGDRVTIRADKTLTRGRIADGAFETWRAGWLETDAMALSEVVARLNRHTQTPIVVEGEALAATAITGRFRLDNPDETIEKLSTLLNLEVDRRAENLTLSPRAPE